MVNTTKQQKRESCDRATVLFTEKFNKIPSIEALIDTRRMQFLGKIVRGSVTSPPRQILIAFCPTNRASGGPIACNRKTMLGSLVRLFKDVKGIHINSLGSLKDWYLDALDEGFWMKCVARFKDPSKPIPTRPNRDSSFNPRRSSRNKGNGNQESKTPSPVRERNNRRIQRRNTSKPNQGDQNFNYENVGQNLFDSLKILGLGYDATWTEVKTSFRLLARMYHPDQHKPEQTGMSKLEAQEYFQMLNNARDYLKDQLT